jgi:hypothetical protein
LFRRFQPVAVYFTPIAWTCYILLADAAVLAIRGHSRLHDEPGVFLSVAVLSISLWLIFEAYNLGLQNWSYSGVPVAWPLALLGYGWSFATIFPGIFETADLIESFGWFPPRAPIRFSAPARRAMIFFGRDLSSRPVDRAAASRKPLVFVCAGVDRFYISARISESPKRLWMEPSNCCHS